MAKRTGRRPKAAELLRRDPVLREMGAALRRYGAELIVPFGSRARVVVVRRTERRFLDRLREVDRALAAVREPVDVFVYTPEEFRDMQERARGVILRSEGVVLYRRRRRS